MRDWVDVYFPWVYVFGVPVVCFLLALMLG